MKIIEKKLDIVVSGTKNRSDKVIFIILNGFFIVSILCLLVATINKLILGPQYQGGSVFVIAIISILIYCLLLLFKKGYVKIVNYLLLSITFYLIFNIIIASGAENPFAIIMIVFYSILSSIIFSNKKSFLFSTALIILLFLVLAFLQTKGITSPNLDWKETTLFFGDALSIIFVLFIIIMISWLFNNEINRYIQDLEKSEKLLQKERDLLEDTVQKRTERLQIEQSEKLKQFAKIAEFGRLSQGLFHDLVNPLTALSLNLNQIKKKGGVDDLIKYVDGSIAAAENMQKLIDSTKEYFHDKVSRETFSIKEEITKTKQLYNYKANKAGVKLDFQENDDVKIIGNSTKFSQLINNLVLNAIEAYEHNKKLLPPTVQKTITIQFKAEGESIKILVKDNAFGMKEEVRKNLFKPFYTTKEKSGNSGIGLSICQDIVESHFLGKISVKSIYKEGTEFIVKLPILTQSIR